MAIPQGEAEGQIALIERHNNMVLEHFFLRLLSEGFILLVLYKTVTEYVRSSWAVPIDL